MNIELDFLTWVTGLAIAAQFIAVIGMIIRGSYLRRKERTRGKRGNVRRRG